MERTCPRCRYNTLSQVVAACPNCGAPLPGARVRGGGLGRAVSTLIFFVIAGTGAVWTVRVLRSPDPVEAMLGPVEAIRDRVEALVGTPPSTASAATVTAPPRPAALDVDALLRELTSRDASRRREAARKLGASGDRRAISPLLSAARDLRPAVRAAALEALARLASRTGVPPDERARVEAALVRGASDPDTGVRAAATRATATLAASR